MKQSTCCKSIFYKSPICLRCDKPCTLEDIPVCPMCGFSNELDLNAGKCWSSECNGKDTPVKTEDGIALTSTPHAINSIIGLDCRFDEFSEYLDIPVYNGLLKQIQNLLIEHNQSERELWESDMKRAFIKHFHESGEQWFNYAFADKEEEENALYVVEEHWNDIIKLIQEK